MIIDILEPKLTNKQKEDIIAQALKDYALTQLLVESMAEPKRGPLEYSSVGRKLLKVSDLPQGALARHERHQSAITYVMAYTL